MWWRIKWIPMEVSNLVLEIFHRNYIFVVENFLIKIHLKKLWAHKVVKFIMWELWDSCLMSLGKNNHFNVVPMRRSQLYYKEEGGSSPMSKLCECNESKTNPWPKIDSIFTNHLHCLACSNDLFMKCFWTWHIILIGILKLSHIHFSLMCKNKECAPNSFSFYLFFCSCHSKVHLLIIWEELKCVSKMNTQP
jgi:hypothetical protein